MDDVISVIELANQLDKRKQSIFKILRRLNIEPVKMTGANSRGALAAYVTHDQARLVRDVVEQRGQVEPHEADGSSNETTTSVQQGIFYLLSLEPDHDKGRFKVGFTTNISERLRTLRCSAPFATVTRSWPCKSLWEKTAIDCISAGCERLHTEVFRTTDISAVLSRCEAFFALMPKPSEQD